MMLIIARLLAPLFLVLGNQVSVLTAGASVAGQVVTGVQMEVMANQGWQDSGIYVNSVSTVQIDYLSGSWTYWPGHISMHDANGGSPRYVCADRESAQRCVEPLPQANKGMLIARVGDYDTNAIGNSGQINTFTGGELYLRMNSSNLPSDYSQGQGSIVVRVTITQN
jgi:hypothetical protein